MQLHFIKGTLECYHATVHMRDPSNSGPIHMNHNKYMHRDIRRKLMTLCQCYCCLYMYCGWRDNQSEPLGSVQGKIQFIPPKAVEGNWGRCRAWTSVCLANAQNVTWMHLHLFLHIKSYFLFLAVFWLLNFTNIYLGLIFNLEYKSAKTGEREALWIY